MQDSLPVYRPRGGPEKRPGRSPLACGPTVLLLIALLASLTGRQDDPPGPHSRSFERDWESDTVEGRRRERPPPRPLLDLFPPCPLSLWRHVQTYW